MPFAAGLDKSDSPVIPGGSMLVNIGQYRKALASLGAVLTALLNIIPADTAVYRWISLAVAVLTTLGVYALPNDRKPDDDDAPALGVPVAAVVTPIPPVTPADPDAPAAGVPPDANAPKHAASETDTASADPAADPHVD